MIHPPPLRRATALTALAVMIAGCADLPAAPQAFCVVAMPAALAGSVPPSMSSIVPLLGDATERLVPGVGTAADVEQVRRGFATLTLAWSAADDTQRCEALNAVRSTVASMRDDPSWAADRAAIQLVLDLASAAAAEATH